MLLGNINETKALLTVLFVALSLGTQDLDSFINATTLKNPVIQVLMHIARPTLNDVVRRAFDVSTETCRNGYVIGGCNA